MTAVHKKSNGNYSVLVGYISNFSVKKSSDGTYECTTELTSLGHAGMYKQTNDTIIQQQGNTREEIPSTVMEAYCEELSRHVANIKQKEEREKSWFSWLLGSSNPEGNTSITTVEKEISGSMRVFVPLDSILEMCSKMSAVSGSSFTYKLELANFP